MTTGRRRFLQAMFGAACGVALGDEILETLDRLAPRPVVVPGADLSGYTPVVMTSELSGLLLLASGGVINFNSGDVTITHAANMSARSCRR